MKIMISVALAFFLIGCGSDSDTQEVKKEVKTVVAPVKAEVKETQKPKVEVATKSEVKSGKEIFSACLGCHGADASKKALGKSHVIKGWDAQKITDALDGYKAGTYGGSMKGLMKSQASKLSDADIKAVAEYISKL